MRRTEQVQGLRLMKFEEVYGRTHRGGLSQAEAAEVLGVSERTFRRWRDRYEAEGADGLYDRRLGRLSARRAPVDEVARVLELFDTRYWDFTAKHFHEKLVADHGFKRSYNWLRLSLQAHGRRRAAPRRGAHRRKRSRRALPGMMLHQDGSSHEWVPGRWWDLIVTMDDATSDIYSAFFVAEEGTMSSFQGVSEAIRAKGLFCSLYADRASHYWNTPEAGGKVDKDTPTQVGRALAQLGIELIPAYVARGKGALGAHVRHLAEAPAPGTQARRHHRHGRGQPLPQGGLPATTQRPLRDPGRGPGHRLRPLHRRARRHPVHPRGTHRLKRQHGALQAPGTSDPRRPPPPPLRQGQGPRPRIPRRHNGRLPWTAMSGAITPMANRSTAKPARPRDPLRRDRPGCVDKWTAAPHRPLPAQGQKPQQKRSTHMVHKPVNSECSPAGCKLRIGNSMEHQVTGSIAQIVDERPWLQNPSPKVLALQHRTNARALLGSNICHDLMHH